MDINKVLNEYDSMFAKNTPDEISSFLAEHIEAAEREGDRSSLLTLLNEHIGFARDRGMKETALEGCRRLYDLIPELDMEGTMPHGMTLLNIANAYRAFGSYEKAEELFGEIQKIYSNNLQEGAAEYAALYNNWSLLALSKGEASRAADLIVRALEVVDRYDRAVIEQATSRVNLACILMSESDNSQTEKDRLLGEAGRYIDEAIERFEAAGGDDYHFSAALSARGDLLMKTGSYDEAVSSYERAKGIIRMYLGDDRKTSVLDRKIELAKERSAG